MKRDEPREQWSRQRISKLRIEIFRDLLIWTLQSPNRLTRLPQLSLVFHELCYTKQRETVVEKSGQKYCRLCVRRGREPWHPLEVFSTENNRVLKYCRSCTRQTASDSYETHKDHKKAYDKQYRKERPVKWLCPKVPSRRAILYGQGWMDDTRRI